MGVWLPLNDCCFFLSLRTGSLIILWLGLVSIEKKSINNNNQHNNCIRASVSQSFGRSYFYIDLNLATFWEVRQVKSTVILGNKIGTYKWYKIDIESLITDIFWNFGEQVLLTECISYHKGALFNTRYLKQMVIIIWIFVVVYVVPKFEGPHTAVIFWKHKQALYVDELLLMMSAVNLPVNTEGKKAIRLDRWWEVGEAIIIV